MLSSRGMGEVLWTASTIAGGAGLALAIARVGLGLVLRAMPRKPPMRRSRDVRQSEDEGR
jgi:hypothetical protein